MQEVTDLLFELSSVERVRLLHLITEGEQRLTKLAKTIDITTSETSRHLSRLLKAGLVTKDDKGAYGLTYFGKLLVRLTPYLEFLTKWKSYILQHDFTILPEAFIARLGELGQATIFEGPYQVIDVQSSSVEEATQRIWIMSGEIFWSMVPLLEEKARKGVDVKVIIPRNLRAEAYRERRTLGYDLRFLEQVDFSVTVLDDRGGFSLPDKTGKIDLSTMLAGEDKATYKWLEDLFLYYWKQTEGEA